MRRFSLFVVILPLFFLASMPMLFAQTVSGKPTIPPPSSSTKPPSVNMEELAKNTAYPKEAKEQNLEGMVNIAVLIGTDSTAKEVRIESSTNPIFNHADIAAAKKTRLDAAYRKR